MSLSVFHELLETDPLDQDSDEDGLTEWEEVRGFDTDPLLLDSDHDMIFEGIEVGRYVNTLAEVYSISKDTLYDVGAMAHDGDGSLAEEDGWGSYFIELDVNDWNQLITEDLENDGWSDHVFVEGNYAYLTSSV